MRTLTIEQVGQLVTKVIGSPLELPVALGLGCGLRRNELLALRWRDIDWNRSTFVVAQSMDVDESAAGPVFRFKSPKSGKARGVAIPGFVMEALRRHRVQQNEERLRLGPEYKVSYDLVLASAKGEPLHPERFTAAFRRAVKLANLPDCGSHILRHTCATLALAAGANPLVVSQALGHHDPGFTLRQYAHVLPGMQAQAASAMDQTLRQALSAGEPRTVAGKNPA